MFFCIKKRTTISKLKRKCTFIVIISIVISNLSYYPSEKYYAQASDTMQTQSSIIKPGTGEIRWRFH